MFQRSTLLFPVRYGDGVTFAHGGLKGHKAHNLKPTRNCQRYVSLLVYQAIHLVSTGVNIGRRRHDMT